MPSHLLVYAALTVNRSGIASGKFTVEGSDKGIKEEREDGMNWYKRFNGTIPITVSSQLSLRVDLTCLIDTDLTNVSMPESIRLLLCLHTDRES